MSCPLTQYKNPHQMISPKIGHFKMWNLVFVCFRELVFFPLELISGFRVRNVYHVVIFFIPTPEESNSKSSCRCIMYFVVLLNNKVTYIVIAFNGCLSVVYVAGAGKSELSIMNKRISLLRILVFSKYTDIYFSNFDTEKVQLRIRRRRCHLRLTNI